MIRILNALAVAAVAISLESCATLPIPGRESPNRMEIRELNGGGDPINLGIVYVLQQGTPHLVLDVLTQLQPNDDSGGELRTAQQNPGRLILSRVKAGDLAGFCSQTSSWTYMLHKDQCRERPEVELAIDIISVTKTQLANPFLLLDVLNRPVSGLSYNREAEEKVMQWRTSLAGAISGGGEHVAICTDMERASQAAIVVRGHLDQGIALRLAKDLVAGSAVHALWDEAKTSVSTDGSETRVPIDNQLVIEATYREIGLVNTSTAPRIDFTLGGFHSVTIGRAESSQ